MLLTFCFEAKHVRCCSCFPGFALQRSVLFIVKLFLFCLFCCFSAFVLRAAYASACRLICTSFFVVCASGYVVLLLVILLEWFGEKSPL